VTRSGKPCRVAAAARSGAALDGHYAPALAREDHLEVSIKELAVGRRDFEAERVVTVPHDLATDLPPRTGDESGEQFPFAILDGPGNTHNTGSRTDRQDYRSLCLPYSIVRERGKQPSRGRDEQ
jgi:hypothetical protein